MANVIVGIPTGYVISRDTVEWMYAANFTGLQRIQFVNQHLITFFSYVSAHKLYTPLFIDCLRKLYWLKLWLIHSHFYSSLQYRDKNIQVQKLYRQTDKAMCKITSSLFTSCFKFVKHINNQWVRIHRVIFNVYVILLCRPNRWGSRAYCTGLQQGGTWRALCPHGVQRQSRPLKLKTFVAFINA